jgi:hypothetical protein
VPKHRQFQISEDRHLVVMCLAGALMGFLAAAVAGSQFPLGPARARVTVLTIGGIAAFGVGDQYLRLFAVDGPSESGELRPLWFMWVSYFLGFAAWAETGVMLKAGLLFVATSFFVLSGLLAISARLPRLVDRLGKSSGDGKQTPVR